MKALPPFFCAAIAPHLHGSTGGTKGVIFPTSQFYFRAAGWLGGGGCEAERADYRAWLWLPGHTEASGLINPSPQGSEEHL